MGRNKFSQDEINDISKLLRLKNAGNRYKQKLIRHDLRARDEAAKKTDNTENETTDWKEAMKEWEKLSEEEKSQV